MAKNKLTVFKKSESPEAFAENAATMTEHFNSGFNLDAVLGGAERRNAPRMFKPGDVPIGAIVHGLIVRVLNSPKAEIKGKLLWLTNEKGDCTFPITGVIKQALGDDPEKEIGKYFVAKRLPDGRSHKFGDDGAKGSGKRMFMFDVYTLTPEQFSKLSKKSS